MAPIKQASQAMPGAALSIQLVERLSAVETHQQVSTENHRKILNDLTDIRKSATLQSETLIRMEERQNAGNDAILRHLKEGTERFVKIEDELGSMRGDIDALKSSDDKQHGFFHGAKEMGVASWAILVALGATVAFILSHGKIDFR